MIACISELPINVYVVVLVVLLDALTRNWSIGGGGPGGGRGVGDRDPIYFENGVFFRGAGPGSQCRSPTPRRVRFVQDLPLNNNKKNVVEDDVGRTTTNFTTVGSGGKNTQDFDSDTDDTVDSSDDEGSVVDGGSDDTAIISSKNSKKVVVGILKTSTCRYSNTQMIRVR